MADLYTRLVREILDLICASVAFTVSLVALVIILSPLAQAGEHPSHYACVDKKTGRHFAFAFQQHDAKHVWLAFSFKDALGDSDKLRLNMATPIVSSNGVNINDAEQCANWGVGAEGIIIPNVGEKYSILFCGATHGYGSFVLYHGYDYTTKEDWKIVDADCENADVGD